MTPTAPFSTSPTGMGTSSGVKAATNSAARPAVAPVAVTPDRDATGLSGESVSQGASERCQRALGKGYPHPCLGCGVPFLALWLDRELYVLAECRIPGSQPYEGSFPMTNPCHDSGCTYPEPHRHGFACDKTCQVCEGR